MKMKYISPKKIYCDRCARKAPAYYDISNQYKKLCIQCEQCGTHNAKFMTNLDIPEFNKHEYYRKTHQSLQGRLF